MAEKNPGEDLAGVLERARKLRPKLENAADRLNDLINTAEVAIGSLGLGVRADVVLEFDPEDGWHRSLVFGKFDKSWRLFVETGTRVRAGISGDARN